MGFFADVVADSRHEFRQPGGSVSVAGPEMAGSHLPEQLSQPNQSQPVPRPDATTAQNVGQDALATKSVEGSQPANVQRSHTPDVAEPAQSSIPPISQPTQAAAPPTFTAAKVTAGTPQIQRKSIRVTPPSAKKPIQSAVTKRAETIRSDLSASHQTSVAEERAVKAETVYRGETPAPLVAEQTHVEQPPQSTIATPTSQERPTASGTQGGSETVVSKAVTPTEAGLLSQPYSADEPAPSAPVMAGAVEQASSSQPLVPMTAAVPPRSTSTAKAAPPQVRIGQVNVIVEAPAKPERAPTSTPMSSDMASRNFLRSL